MLELVNRFEQCATRQKESSRIGPMVFVNKCMYDIKTWLAPHLSDIHGHTTPHAFSISRNAEDIVVMKYKKWSSTSENWIPDIGIPIFKVYIYYKRLIFYI